MLTGLSEAISSMDHLKFWYTFSVGETTLENREGLTVGNVRWSIPLSNGLNTSNLLYLCCGVTTRLSLLPLKMKL